MFYKEGEGPLYQPQISRPDYGKEFYYWSGCGKAYYKADKCPNCGIATRKRSRKNNWDKPRVNLDYDDGE